MRQLVPQRDGTLAAELRKQQNNETLRRQFAEKANAVGPWIERQMDAVTAIGMGLQVTYLHIANKKTTKLSKPILETRKDTTLKIIAFVKMTIFRLVSFQPHDIYKHNFIIIRALWKINYVASRSTKPAFTLTSLISKSWSASTRLCKRA